MNDNKRKQLTDTLIDNDDYFFRDAEMFRADIENPKHETDHSINGRNKKEEKKRG